MDIKHILHKAVRSQDLSEDEAYAAALETIKGGLSHAQIAALLVALRMKGETIDEITGFARALRSQSCRINCPGEYLVDTCGTGGDRKGTFNISTVSAFIAAGAGCRVAKHGNRSVSSRCGSADVLKHLGIDIEHPLAGVERCLNEIGIAFLFAPAFHAGIAHVMPARRDIGIRTVFNILGPLVNPAGARRQVIGVYDRSLLAPVAGVLLRLGTEHAFIVHGQDGLDEITTCASTAVCEVKDGRSLAYEVTPEDFGFDRAAPVEILGGGPAENASIMTGVLGKKTGPSRDIALLNAGAAIYVSGRAPTMEQGVNMARDSIDSGRAWSKLETLRRLMPGMANELS